MLRASAVRKSAQAIVTNNEDPEKLGRIKVKCGEYLGTSAEIPFWISPRFPHGGVDRGFFFIPEIGDAVEIDWVEATQFEVVYGQSALVDPNFRWTSTLYRDDDEVPSEFRKKYGKRFGIKAGENLLLMFDTETKEASLVGDKVFLGGYKEGDLQPAVAGDDYVSGRQNALDDIAAAMASLSGAWGAFVTAVNAVGTVDGDTLLAALKLIATPTGPMVSAVDDSATAGTTCTSESADTPNHLSDVVKLKK